MSDFYTLNLKLSYGRGDLEFVQHGAEQCVATVTFLRRKTSNTGDVLSVTLLDVVIESTCSTLIFPAHWYQQKLPSLTLRWNPIRPLDLYCTISTDETVGLNMVSRKDHDLKAVHEELRTACM